MPLGHAFSASGKDERTGAQEPQDEIPDAWVHDKTVCLGSGESPVTAISYNASCQHDDETTSRDD
ncbi:MAG: hypothetical protein ACYCSO_10090 [Cuniculiplasma sp.]